MSNIKYTYIPLDKATIVDRRHQREVQPPGMVNLENFLPARSDSSPTLRPDWWYTEDQVYGISSVLTLPDTSTLRDALNAANGLYGSDQVTFFTTFVPYGNDNGTFRVLSGTHNDGTVSAKAGGSSIVGEETAFLEKAYRGAIIRTAAGAVGTFTGSPHVWIESTATTGEWYLAELDGTELDLVADEIYYVNLTKPSGTFKIGTIGSLTNRSLNIGDGDTLGFNALYVKIDGNDPDTFTSTDNSAFTVETCINISGSNTKWNASGAGTNEYYLTTRAGGDPFSALVSGYVASGTLRYRYGSIWRTETFDRYYYIKNKLSSIASTYTDQVEETNVTEGTVGSLTEFQANYDDNETPALSFDTIYIRDNTGSPDVQAAGKADAALKLPVYFLAQTAGYKWVVATSDSNGYWYKLQTNAGGDPGIDEPIFVVSGVAEATGWLLGGYLISESTAFTWETGWRYGDFDEDGYNTIYLNYGRQDPDAITANPAFFYYKYIYSSNYSWVASATSNEYYLAQQDGAEITADFDEPYAVVVNDFYSLEGEGGTSSRGVIGALADGQWGYGTLAGDSLTYSTIYIRWDAGDPDTENLKVVARYRHNSYASEYTWTESPATSDEWYIAAWDGTTATDPSIGEPTSLVVNGTSYTRGTVGSLAAGEYDYGNNDTLGYNTIYIYSANAVPALADPDGDVGTGLGDEIEPFIIGSEESTDSFDYYVIDHVVNDEELTVYGEIQTSISNIQPTIYYNHNPFNADYKLNIQAYTSGLIYCAPSIRDNLNEEDISGPFYADLQKGDWRYGGEITVDYNFAGSGVLFEKQPSLATNLTSFIQIFPTVDDAGDTGQPDAHFLAYSSGLGGNNAWSKKFFPNPWGVNSQVTVGGDGTSMRLNSIQTVGSTYICAAQVLTGPASNPTACYPGIAYSTTGLSWTTASITTIDGNSTAWTDPLAQDREDSDYQAICAAWNGSSPGRIVCLVWKPDALDGYYLYSDDSGGSWTLVDSYSGTFENGIGKIKYLDGKFILVSEYFLAYGDGSSNTSVIPDAGDADIKYIRDVAFDGDERWVVVTNNFKTWYADGIDGTWTKVALPLDLSSSGDETSFIHWDSIGERFVINSQNCIFWSTDGEEWAVDYINSFGDVGLPKLPSNIIEDYSGLITTLFDGGQSYLRNAIFTRYNYYYWDVVDFIPLSDIYRSITFSVLDGYVVLLGTTEYDEDEGWVYNPRRIRWTAPATYSDFSGTGSGTADANGEGSFMDSRPVNGRIVAFETNRVSAIVPRGDVEDPWDYDVVKEDFRILSNPVTVDDLCYVIATDGLLYATDGIQVTEVGSSFDATKFDDFTENKPIMLEYSRAFNSLIAYYFDASATSHYAYFISTSDGVVTKVAIPELSDSDSLAEEPRFITAVSDSSDQRVIASHHPQSAANDLIITKTLGTNRQISGVDRPVYGSTADDTYWYATLETGELYLAPEGNKTSLKHIIVRTYSDAPGANTDRPRIIAQIKSLEDDEWHTCGDVDVYSTFDIDDDECTTTGEGEAAFTNLMASGSGAGGTTVTVIPPFDPTGCRYYKKTGTTYTLQTSGTDYTATSASAVFTDNGPPAGTDLYAYWENYPEIRISTGDFVESSQSLHRVTGTTGTNASGGLTLDHYLTSGSASEETSTHYPAEQLGDGESEVKIGVNKLVEGFKLRLLVVPHYGATAAPTIVKITGIVFGHVPQGRKILQATGS